MTTSNCSKDTWSTKWRNPPHDGTLSRVLKRLLRLLPPGWDFRSQMALTLSESEPEPDLAIVRESPDGYMSRHPLGTEAGLVIEVADSTLAGDRADKGRIYARASIPVYWIVNIPDQWIEVYEHPSGPCPTPTYAQRRDYHPSDAIPFVLDRNTIAALVVADLLG